MHNCKDHCLASNAYRNSKEVRRQLHYMLAAAGLSLNSPAGFAVREWAENLIVLKNALPRDDRKVFLRHHFAGLCKRLKSLEPDQVELLQVNLSPLAEDSLAIYIVGCDVCGESVTLVDSAA